MASNLKSATAWGHSAGWIRSAAPSRIYAVSGFGLLSLFSSIVCVRGAAGAFSGSICPLSFALCILLASLLCGSLKVAAEWPPHRLSIRPSLIFGILITLPVDALAVALLSAGWTYLGLTATLGWLALLTWFCLSSHSADGLRWLCNDVIWPEVEQFLCPAGPSAAGRDGSKHTHSAASHAVGSPLKDVPRESLISLARDPALNDVLTDEAEGELISRLHRRTLDTGADLLEGQLVASFERGAKQTVLHVPFSPPFSAPPRVDCEVADGSEVRIKVGTVFTYGVRLELKRNSADLSPQNVTIDIYAESTGRR